MSWARATLRRGTSGGSVWQVDANYPQARVVVGSSPSAGWIVTGPGIALFHVELYWDGNVLYIADPQAVGDVRLNGQPVHGWTQVQGRGQLTFGQAILELETAVKEATAMVRDPGTAPRVSLVGESTRIQAPLSDEAELDGESTRVAASLDEIPGSKAVISARPPPPPGRAPAVSAPPPPPRPAAPAPPAFAPTAPAPALGPERPRLGGAPPSFRQEARTLVGEELGPIGGEATRMVDPDALRAGAPASGMGAEPPRVGFGGGAAPFGAPQPGLGPAETSPGLVNPPVVPTGAVPGFGSASPGAAMPPATGGFAPPPSFDKTQQVSQNDGSVPRRTRLMILLFVAVVIAWMMMPTPEEEEAQRAVTAALPPAGGDAGVDAGPRPYLNPSTFVPVLTTEAQDGGLARTPDSIAAQLVADGHLEDALVQYEALLAAHPERPEYAVMREVILRQLMARCTNGMRWDGTPCLER